MNEEEKKAIDFFEKSFKKKIPPYWYDDTISNIEEKIKTILNLIEKQQKEIEKKDKIIDLMAEYISNITDCPFESEGKYLDCEKMCDVRTDKECWKQYFENKAKE